MDVRRIVIGGVFAGLVLAMWEMIIEAVALGLIWVRFGRTPVTATSR